MHMLLTLSFSLISLKNNSRYQNKMLSPAKMMTTSTAQSPLVLVERNRIFGGQL